MKYAYINKNNELIGWYDKEIHTKIPTPFIKVTNEKWKEAINNNHNKINKDGSTERYDFRTDLEKEKQALHQKINEAKQYLSETDYMMSIDYDKDVTEVKTKRQEAREFIRENEVNNG
jgi:NADPH-dependent glutamate synthase beta subunit-like oxidoreductase